MKFYDLIISNIAEEELESIVNYSFITFDGTQAETYLQKIFEAFYRFQQHHKLGYLRSDLPKGFLCYNVEQHCIIYSINVKNKRFNVVRILHSRMDFSQKF